MADDEGATNAEATPRRADAPSVADTRNMLAANGLILMVEACVGYLPVDGNVRAASERRWHGSMADETTDDDAHRIEAKRRPDVKGLRHEHAERAMRTSASFIQPRAAIREVAPA